MLTIGIFTPSHPHFATSKYMQGKFATIPFPLAVGKI